MPRESLMKPALILMVICALTTAALAATDGLTRDAIRSQQVLAEESARKGVFPEADSFREISRERLDGMPSSVAGEARLLAVFEALDESGAGIGYVVQAAIRGYAGDVAVMTGVALSADGTGRVLSARILSDNETPGLGKKVAGAPFLNQFSGKDADEGFAVGADGGGTRQEIDAVTGATISSRAVTEAVNAACRTALHLGTEA